MMTEFINELYIELENQIKLLAIEVDDIFERAEASINISTKIIDRLKEFIINNRFADDDEEILFFKEIKPRFISTLIFYINVYNIETNRPNGSIQIKRKYLQFELNKLKNFFDENLDFYRYYRTRSTYLDHKYFIRGKHDIRLNLDSFVYEADTNFCTSHDFKISSILANDLLQVYLENELTKIEFKSIGKNSEYVPKNMLRWTGSKVSLIELMYALNESGSFNNSQTDIKAIAAYFEKVFDIELGNYYRVYLEMKIRQYPTKFLDSLTTSLKNRIEEDDEK